MSSLLGSKHPVRTLLYRLLPRRLLLPWIFLGKGRRSELARRYGWARSFRRNAPVDDEGRPLPWIPYVAVELLRERLRPELSVLELGAGYSTLFFMGRVARVVSLEHEPSWADWVRARAAANVTVVQSDASSADAYLAPLRTISDRFDLILVDGRHRPEALAAALELLSPRGVVLLDDSGRPQYGAAMEAALATGFRHLHLEGHKAASVGLYRTTIFYRDGNCLGI